MEEDALPRTGRGLTDCREEVPIGASVSNTACL